MQGGKAGVPTQGDLVVTECHCSGSGCDFKGNHPLVWGMCRETLEHLLGSNSKTRREEDFCAVQPGGRSLNPLARQGGHSHFFSVRLLPKGNRWGPYRKSNPSRRDCHELGTQPARSASHDPEDPILSPSCG